MNLDQTLLIRCNMLTCGVKNWEENFIFCIYIHTQLLLMLSKNNRYHLNISAAVDHMNSTSIVVMEMWQRRVTKLYSTISNRNHITVIPPKSAADKFLSLHNKISATASSRIIRINSWIIICQNFIKVTLLYM